jgi:hypothetical protein
MLFSVHPFLHIISHNCLDSALPGNSQLSPMSSHPLINEKIYPRLDTFIVQPGTLVLRRWSVVFPSLAGLLRTLRPRVLSLLLTYHSGLPLRTLQVPGHRLNAASIVVSRGVLYLRRSHSASPTSGPPLLWGREDKRYDDKRM